MAAQQSRSVPHQPPHAMWDTLQDGVYKSRIQDVEELRQRVEKEWDDTIRYDMLVDQLILPHGTNN